jgi:hypothetical protein
MKSFKSFLQTLEDNFSEGGDYSPRIPFSTKYILCTKNDKKILVADTFCSEHMAIKNKYKALEDAEVLGGGEIYFYGREKGFLLTESSVRYGKANHEEAAKLLRGMFEQEITVEIKN